MNPEVESSAAKITRTSVKALVQATVDAREAHQDRQNSGDVEHTRAQATAATAHRPAASAIRVTGDPDADWPRARRAA